MTSFIKRISQCNLTGLFNFRTMSDCVAPLSEGVLNPLKRTSEPTGPEVDEEKKARLDHLRIKRKKCAVLICYSGQGYLGLQRNPGMKTIEEDFLKALWKADVINEEAYNQPKLLEFQRAARTDKGVSAVKQVLSLKLPLEIRQEAINEHLPAQIRLMGVKRATKGFNCKTNCDGRSYSYLLPSFSLAPQELPLSQDFRVTPQILERTNQVLQDFIGTHNYHNFTSKKKSLDPSAKRYIISFVCGEPFIVEDMEFVLMKVRGQSFMLHQIRKMVGLAVAVVRGLAPPDTIAKSYGEDRFDLPIAPGVGLVLEEVHYDRYNQRFGKDGIHEPIEWSTVENELEEFRKQFILPTILKAEKEDKSMLSWLESLPLHSFGLREQGERGAAPAAAEEEADSGEIVATPDRTHSGRTQNGLTNQPSPSQIDETKDN